MEGLNREQRQAVETIRGPLMILAGAGTGKTRVISYRISHMLKSKIPGESIVALTFTNKAAREMRERVRAIAGDSAKNVRLGTFHSFCLFVLRRFPKATGLHPHFSLVDQSEQVDLVRRVLDEISVPGVYRAENLHAQISRAKNFLAQPQDVAKLAKSDRTLTEDPQLLAKVYELYERQLRLNRAIDFDDCILKTVLLLQDNAEVREELQKAHPYLLVDEFQDTNSSQLRVLELLTGPEKNICVVGDDDQSIYAWRGAMAETMEKFEDIFSGAKLIKLEQNYRCTNVILSAANSLIKNNPRRKEKVLWSRSQDETPITCACLEDDVAEGKWIAEKILGLAGQGWRYQNIAVLYRTNSQARLVEMALREAHMPYKTFGGMSFFERKEVKDFLGYLRLIFRPDDHMCLWRVINYPHRGVGLKTQEKIEEKSRATGMPPFVVLSQPDAAAVLGKAKGAVLEFVDKIKSLKKRSLNKPEDMEALGFAIIENFKLDDDIRAHSSDFESRQRRIETLKHLPVWIRDVAGYLVEQNGKFDIETLIDQLTLSDVDEKQDEEEEGNFVSLMTIHAAKGLEFGAVFLSGVEEDLLPHKNSLQAADGLSEERRLFYVAMTRAKIKLHMSYAAMRYSGSQRQPRMPSRFLKEIPDAGVVSEGASLGQKIKIKTEDELIQESKQRISSLRDMLRKK